MALDGLSGKRLHLELDPRPVGGDDVKAAASYNLTAMMVLPFRSALRPAKAVPDAAHIVSDLFALLLIIVVIVGAVTGQPLIASLGGLSLVVTVIARLWSRLSLEEVTYAREFSETRVFAGDEVSLTLTLENRKPLPVPWLKVQDFVPDALDMPDADSTYRTVMGGSDFTKTTSLGRYERVRSRHKVIAAKRGFHRLGPAELESGDLFGLHQSRRQDDAAGPTLIVYPKPVPLPGFYLSSARPIGETRSSVPIWADPTMPNGVREYRPGDPLRSIDWKATARLRSLHVRTYDPSMSHVAVVLYDSVTSEYPWDGYSPGVLEAGVTAAASIASRAAELGYRVGLVTNGVPPSDDVRSIIPPAEGEEQLPLILESLARVWPLAAQSIIDATSMDRASAVPFGATVVLVTGIWKEGAIDYMAGLAARGHPVLIVWVGDGEAPEAGGMTVMDGRTVFGVERKGREGFRRPVRPEEAAGTFVVPGGEAG